MKIALLLSLLCLSCAAQSKDTALVFTNKSDLLKWNTFKLPLGTNMTQQLYEVSPTNSFVVVIPTNAIPTLVKDGRVTDNGGKIDPVPPPPKQ